MFIYQALRGEPISLYGGGTQLRDFNYVDDVVDAMLRADRQPAMPGPFFNLGFDPARSLVEFVEILREFCTSRSASAVSRGLEDHRHRRLLRRFLRFQAATGWEPQIDLREGIARSIVFFSEHEDAYGLARPRTRHAPRVPCARQSVLVTLRVTQDPPARTRHAPRDAGPAKTANGD